MGVLLWAGLFASSSGVCSEPTVRYLELRKDVLETMQAMVVEHSLPSLSLSISLEGEIVFAEAIGYADVEEQIPASVDTRYSVGSVAKPMTGIALARLVDEGTLRWDVDIHKYLPEYPKLDYDLTIRQLASHTGGISHSSMHRTRYEFLEVEDRTSPIDVLDLCTDDPLAFEPGTNFLYSSSGYVLLSALIESASGTDYIQFMKSNVWMPLGMNSTAHDTSKERGVAQARYYSGVAPSGSFIPAIRNRDRSFLFGGGGFISTPSDLVRLGSAVFRDEFLSQEVKRTMLTPVVLEGGEVNKQSYGIGWRMKPMSAVGLDDRELAVVHHGGVTANAATAFLLLVPEYKAALAFSSNCVPANVSKLRSQAGAILVESILARN